ncbi:MAG: cation:proton antiporter [Candidatus Zixiibacteriota bacterium]
MHELSLLKDILLILAVAVIVVAVFYRLRLPSIAGFILSGFIVGPQGLKLISDIGHVEVLAEIGVALLLFGIGMELALSKLKRLWKLAVIGGVLQVGLTIAIAYLIASISGMSDSAAILFGCVVALSSTAIVLHGLQQRGEVDAPHGRLILGILVFQDFSVVPIMLILPFLGGADMSASAFIGTLAKSVGIILAVLLAAIYIVPRALRAVARTKQRQLFILSVFVVCLGTAWLVTRSGASLAIGAFLAGLVVAGSDYRHQALADMISFREVFSSLFFVSVGMLVSASAIGENLGTILLLLAGIIIGKALIVFMAAIVMRMPLRACIIAALALAQVGEFSFIILYAIKGSNVIAPAFENSLVSAAILSMFITPFAMSFAPKLAAGIGKFPRISRMFKVESVEDKSDAICKLCDHIIIAGYGFAGRELSRGLIENGIPFIIVDINIENVRKATQETGKALYGDITAEEVLEQLSITTARELIILINDPGASEHAVRVARKLAPKLHIAVRTFYLLDVDGLLAAGADEVIPAEREAAVEVVSRVLKRHKVESKAISEQKSAVREHTDNDD